MNLNKNNHEIKKFDLFKLHVPNEDVGPRSYVKANGKELFNYVHAIIKEALKENDKITYLSIRIAKKLKCHQDTVLKVLTGKSSGGWIPLPILLELLNEWKISCNKNDFEMGKIKQMLQSKFERLSCGSKKEDEVKATKYLDETLAKIAGAHMADGHLLKFKTSRGVSYRVIVIDMYKSNLEALINWIKDVFSIKAEIVRAESDAWRVTIRNKIIGRYLEVLLGFPCSKKTFFSIPRIIKVSDKDIKEAFTLGFMTFDGCVETDKTVSLGIACERLRNELAEILEKAGLTIKKQKKKEFFHIKTSVLSKEGLKQWQTFFEPKTEKWYKLNDMIYGFKEKAGSLDKAITIISKTYDGTATNKVNLRKIILKLRELGICDKYILANELKISVSTLYRYIHLLESAKIIHRTKNPKKVYLTNLHPSYTRIIVTREFIKKLFTKLKENYLRKDLALKLNVCEGSVNNWAQYRHNILLNRLEKLLTLANLKIESSSVIGFNRMIFVYNSRINEWRVPYRPWLASYYH